MHAKLLSVYRKSCYEVDGAEVRVGRRCPAMDRLLARYHAREAAFVTAYNPYSRAMPPRWNERMQSRLVQATRRRVVLRGVGYWKRWSEFHLLIVGDHRPLLILARLFRQHGIVIVRRGQPAQLLLIC